MNSRYRTYGGLHQNTYGNYGGLYQNPNQQIDRLNERISFNSQQITDKLNLEISGMKRKYDDYHKKLADDIEDLKNKASDDSYKRLSSQFEKIKSDVICIQNKFDIDVKKVADDVDDLKILFLQNKLEVKDNVIHLSLIHI